VRRALEWINPPDLVGVERIRLVDRIEEPHAQSPGWHRQAHAEAFGVLGLYMREEKNRPAYINLYVSDIYRGIPSPLYLTTIPTLLIAHTLAHEVGHHLVAARSYIFQPGEKYNHDQIEEEFCNRYAFGVLQRMKERRLYRAGAWVLRRLAGWHYGFGALEWREKRYQRAAERFYTAFHLDPGREDACYWYWRAKAQRHA
jgi:hypothetical protein